MRRYRHTIIRSLALFLTSLFLQWISFPWGAVSFAETEPSTPKKLVVIGVKNDVDRPELNDQLIGYGISSLLLQKLFDTGRYIPIENNPEIIEAINGLIKRQWMGGEKLFTPKEADEASAQFRSDAVAYAKITKCETSQSKGMFGPFSKARSKVIMEVEIHVKEKNADLRSATGEGEAATSSSTLLYKMRDDKIYFDQTALGQATEKAIIAAVEKLQW